MHEMALAQDLLRILLEKAPGQKIAYAKVKIGAARVSHPAELLELFGMVSKGTPAEGAKLDIEVLPVKGRCADCGKEFIPEKMRLDCEGCGSTNIQIASGNELVIAETR